MKARRKPRLYVVATSHLDTQWRWSIQTTIRHFLKRTLQDNFARLRDFPEYVLSFEGAFRYQLIEEYYPEDFRRLERLVRTNRWRVAGSMMDAPDTILPSPESLIRHVLYGNGYFEKKFGKRSTDVFLPDCFGFPWSLPTIAAHCGLEGFSSQKLIKWFSPKKIPFDVGLWEGPDGSHIVAVLDPGGYGEPLREDLSRSATWTSRLIQKRADSGFDLGYKYFGVGDRGGAPDPTSLDWLRKSLSGDGDLEVIHAGSDQFFRDLTPDERSALPVHRGDLLLPTHGTGCWTSQAILKKWNRRCEILAESAERAALAAEWLGGQTYPRKELEREWTRFLWHQMHDDLTGTSSPESYRFTWNDLRLAQNRLSALLRTSVAEVARGLDTGVEGSPIVIFNSLGSDREDLVDAWLRFDSKLPAAVRILNPFGDEVACQELERDGDRVRILFEARVPSVGFAVYEARAAPESGSGTAELTVSTKGLENWKYRVKISESGSIESIFDKELERELLRNAADLVLLPDHSSRWPAWELRYEDVKSPEAHLEGPARIRVVEDGPVRAAIEITRTSGRSSVRQRISLTRGESGARLEIDNDVDWQSPASLLKAKFPLVMNDAVATYDMGLGSVERETNRRRQYEVPAHEWADLSTDDWGVSVLSRHKYGWDRPNSGTLRLSLLRSPKAFRRFAHQAMQDRGRHRFAYAIFGHSDRPGAATVEQAERFNRPLLPFLARHHSGALGRRFSLARLDSDAVRLMALKKAEESERWLARVRESTGRDAKAVTLEAAAGFTSAWEVDGCERSEAPRTVARGKLTVDVPRFAPRSFLLSPGRPPHQLPPLQSMPLEMPFNIRATSRHGRAPTNFDGNGHSIPGELFPSAIRAGGHRFKLGPSARGADNAVSCRGQSLSIPEGGHDRFSFLAASTDPPGTSVRFGWGAAGRGESVRIPYYSGFIGQWKRYRGRLGFLLRRWQPGFIERTEVAWAATHRHDGKLRDQAYVHCYLFFFDLPIPEGSTSLELPDAPAVMLFGAVVSRSAIFSIEPATLLYD